MVTAAASPSLALIKYWGKLPGGVNLPATPSLAVTLDGLRTTTHITEASGGQADAIIVGGEPQPPEPYAPIIDRFRSRAGSQTRVRVESANDFPTAAGIASSSSGFAALSIGLDAFFGTGMPAGELSATARLGSGSASRAVYGGFTVWEAGSAYAQPILSPSHWPELRILVVVLDSGRKAVSSRTGMRRTSETSPVYEAWCSTSQQLFQRGRAALEARDLEALGTAMRESYLFMFSTMFTTKPPVIYWLPESVAVIREAEALRSTGVPVWETMDAGPQVKLLTTSDHVAAVNERIRAAAPGASTLVARPGGAPEVHCDA